MRLTQFTDYGLRVLMYVGSREGQLVTTEEIAKLFAVSRNHLIKVVRRLCALGYVEARRGPQGGVRFLPATWDVTVGEVVRNLESQMALVECFDEATNTCPITSVCQLAGLLERASAAFLSELETARLSDLVARPAELRSALPVHPRDSGKRPPRPPARPTH